MAAPSGVFARSPSRHPTNTILYRGNRDMSTNNFHEEALSHVYKTLSQVYDE
jgi:hypothetical protein